jgi:ribosome-associated protein
MLKTVKKTAPAKKPAKKTVRTAKVTAVKPLHIAEDLSWNFGEDVVVYDVRERTPYVSYYIVGSAANDKRLQALVSEAQQSLYDNYEDVDHVEGRNDSQWILIDAHDIVVQLFTRNERNRVNFDGLFEDCPHCAVEAKKEPKYRKRKPKPSQENA